MLTGKHITKSKKLTRSRKAGISFPVGRIHRYLRLGHYAERITDSAPVYFASVLEYLVSEVLDIAGNVSKENKHYRITPRDLHFAIQSDDELSMLLANVTISGAGVVPHIHPALLPKTSKYQK